MGPKASSFEVGASAPAWGSDVLFSPELTRRQNIMLTHLSNGYSNAEALRMATSGNAELLQLSGPRNPYQGKICILAEGALADLLVVAGNLLGDIKFLEGTHKNFAVIMKGAAVCAKNML